MLFRILGGEGDGSLDDGDDVVDEVDETRLLFILLLLLLLLFNNNGVFFRSSFSFSRIIVSIKNDFDMTATLQSFVKVR